MTEPGSEVRGWTPDLREYFAKKASSYDRVGEEPYWHFSDVLLWRHVTRLIGRRHSESFRLLDAGGGTGRWTVKVLREYSHAQAVIVDISEEMLSVAGNSLRTLGLTSRCRLVRADLDALADEVEGTFDVIFCFHNVLGFVATPLRVIGELASRLSSSGLLLIVIPNQLHAIHYSILRGAFGEVRRVRSFQEVRFSSGPPMRVFDPVGICQEIESLGLAVSIWGFPLTVYPAPSATFARANDAIGTLLSDQVVAEELVELEWEMSLRSELASRGNNLLLAIRR